jgi:L-malate glycosyltransferase
VPVLIDIDAFERTPPDPAIPRLDATTWLFVGRLAPNKAQHDIVKAFAVYRRVFDPTARLRLVGGSSSHSYQNSLADFIAALGLRDAIDVTGPVSSAALSAYYETSDVLVVCSDHEGFLVPLLEAMSHRLPIVAYRAGAVPETLGDAGLTLAVKDGPTVAAAVHRVMTDDALRAQLVVAGERRLRDFSLDVTRQKLYDALTPVVGAAT